MELAVRAGSHVIDLYRQGKQHIIGDRHPLGASVFVNQSAEQINGVEKRQS
jgi:hypothetical protein